MKYYLFVISVVLMPITALAGDLIEDHSVADAMNNAEVAQAVGNEVTFYFAGQQHPSVQRKMGEYQSNKRTNALNKTPKFACQWALASALLSLKKRALQEGGNAVINIKSNYKGFLTSSPTTFKCGVGSIMVGVTLKGDVVRL